MTRDRQVNVSENLKRMLARIESLRTADAVATEFNRQNPETIQAPANQLDDADWYWDVGTLSYDATFIEDLRGANDSDSVPTGFPHRMPDGRYYAYSPSNSADDRIEAVPTVTDPPTVLNESLRIEVEVLFVDSKLHQTMVNNGDYGTHGWQFRVNGVLATPSTPNDLAMELTYSFNGSTILSAQSTEQLDPALFALPPFVSFDHLQKLAVTRDSVSGEIVFYTWDFDTEEWVQFGDAVPGTPGSLYDPAGTIELGRNAAVFAAIPGRKNTLAGNLYNVRVYNDIDGSNLVMDFDPDRDAPAPTAKWEKTFTSSTTGETWDFVTDGSSSHIVLVNRPSVSELNGSVLDDPVFDMELGDDATYAIWLRQTEPIADVLLDKGGLKASAPAWAAGGTGTSYSFSFVDASLNLTAPSSPASLSDPWYGYFCMHAVVRDTVADTISYYIYDPVADALALVVSATDLATDTYTNANPMSIGPIRGSWIGNAMWRRALTPTELVRAARELL